MFLSKKLKSHIEMKQSLTTTGLHILAAPADKPVEERLRAYARELKKKSCLGQIGFITSRSAVVPYLSVRSNIFLRGHEHDLDILPSFFTTDPNFLQERADHISELQRIYIEFYRNALDGHRFIFMSDLADGLDRASARRMMTDFDTSSRRLGISLMMLTSDQSMLRDFPDNSDTAPSQLFQ
ncbi:hypothetical protein PQ472_07635 [Lacticaseibacillus pabuli]|uniref:Uncharacterized protein n=1 Tax=Lacticaseibacillus pabuli TaxID=3025672 RepID=A0ABY7WNM2_9LACO|nr:hypothetical protein [Lacticaseibacillus sp. KACC 23028]WDF81795.1 hypothetical protein PQ472_07635 [Lacticaseibacillus sp. KACC 23028]